MKKRSLFAAVAMLIVSAIVLTSATYAWFATSANATINTIQSSTATASSGVRLKTTVEGAEWKDTLSQSEFTSATNDKIVSGNNKLSPVTSANGANFLAYDISSANKFSKKSSPTVGTDYSQYEFYVGTVNEGDKVTGTLTVGGTLAGAARVAVFATPYGGSESLVGIYSGGDTTWNPITTEIATDTVTDTNKNGIIDTTGDDGYTTGLTETTCVNAASGAAAFSATASTPFVPGQVGNATTGQTLVRVVYWLEGQDADCTALNAGSTKTIETSWSFQATAASA